MLARPVETQPLDSIQGRCEIIRARRWTRGTILKQRCVRQIPSDISSIIGAAREHDAIGTEERNRALLSEIKSIKEFHEVCDVNGGQHDARKGAVWMVETL